MQARAVRFFLAIVTICLWNVTSFAEVAATPLKTKVKTARLSGARAETGLSIGTPSGVNLVLGVRGSSAFPCVIRASGMYLGSNIGWGAELEASWIFDAEGGFTQTLGVGISRTELTIKGMGADALRLQGVGPVYGFNWYGFTLSTGLFFGREDRFKVSDRSTGQVQSPFIHLALGYSFIW